MSAFDSQRRTLSSQQHLAIDDANHVAPHYQQQVKLHLDLNDLLPTQAQIASYNSYSTGNTPTSSPSGAASCDYSPPMDSKYLPRYSQTTGMEELTKWIDSLLSGAGVQPASSRDQHEEWKDVLFSQDFTHEDYCGTLLHAAEAVSQAYVSFSELGGSTAMISIKGFVTGLPLRTIAWTEISAERLDHMSTMVVCSGILQACEALQALNVTISRARATALESKTKMRKAEDANEYVHPVYVSQPLTESTAGDARDISAAMHSSNEVLFKAEDVLLNSLKSMRQNPKALGERYQCAIVSCPKTYTSKGGLNFHYKNSHTNQLLKKHANGTFSVAGRKNVPVAEDTTFACGSYVCGGCEEQFNTKIDVDLHQAQNAKCAVFPIVYEKVLNEEPNESEEKPHACEACGKRYRLRNSLNYHRKQTAKCAAFIRSSGQKVEAEQPYACEVCGKRYTREAYYRSHSVACARNVSASGIITVDATREPFAYDKRVSDAVEKTID